MNGQGRDCRGEVAADEGSEVLAARPCDHTPRTRRSWDVAACRRTEVQCRELCACEIPTSSVV